MNKKIEIGIGIGDVKFGMSPDQVKSILGEPDEVNKQIYSEEDPDYYTIEWHYDAIELSVVFDMMETLELTTISISGSVYTLEGKELIGNSIEQVMALLDNTDLSSEWEELEEEEDNARSFVNDEEGLSLYFENGLLSELQLEML